MLTSRKITKFETFAKPLEIIALLWYEVRIVHLRFI